MDMQRVSQSKDASQEEIMPVGVDPGFGCFKLAYIDDEGRMKTIKVLSIAGMGKINEESGINMAGLDNQTRDDDIPFHVQFGGKHYLVGAGTERFARPIEDMTNRRFTAGEELRAMFYAALSQANISNRKVFLVVGLSTELMKKKKDAAITKKRMADWMVGKHTFKVDGVENVIEVVEIRTAFQSMGSWLDLALTNGGKWVKGFDREAPISTLDQGYGTFDIFTIIDGKPSDQFTDGTNLGMSKVAEMICKEVSREYNVPLTLISADRLMRLYLSNETPMIYVHGKPVNIRPIVEQSFNTVTSEVTKFAGQTIGKLINTVRIIFAGGGAISLNGRLKNQYKFAELAPSPQLTNARGLAKLAVMMFNHFNGSGK